MSMQSIAPCCCIVSCVLLPDRLTYILSPYTNDIGVIHDGYICIIRLCLAALQR